VKRTIIAIVSAGVLLAGCGTSTGGSSAVETQPVGGSSSEPAGESSAPAEETPTPKPTKTITKSQEQALGQAQSYLESQSFSKLGLIDQLSSEYGSGFPLKDAKWAVAQLDVDWKDQAVKSAESYLESQNFSCKGLVDQLSSEYGSRFTKDEAKYAAKKVGLC
jgi:hypothetical protein